VIIVKLMGGLGNQMFQYALARKLSLLHDVSLKFDVSQFEARKIRKYSLNHFNVIENFAAEDDIVRIKGLEPISFRKIAEKILPYYKRSYICERNCNFDLNILRSPENVYLNGFWQSEYYFEDVKDILLREFTIKTKQDSVNEQISALIKSVNGVSLHIRRTDYVTDANVSQFHGTCDLSYYERAVKIIAREVLSPHFFVFSDDIAWAKKNLRLKYPTEFISHNDSTKDFEDLRLMSECDHHIIANSTFSWWGAWLNKKDDKIVIAPDRWFNDERVNTKDLIPNKWIRV